MSDEPHLSAVPTPDLADVTDRFMALRTAAQQAEVRTMIGGICAEFTNDEIHLLAEHLLNIGEVLTLRRLGLLAPDEGWTGGPKTRQEPRP